MSSPRTPRARRHTTNGRRCRCRWASRRPSSTGTRTRSRSPRPKGAWLTDVDGRQLLDLSMGFGAMLVGHLNPTVVEAVTKALDVGTLYVTPVAQHHRGRRAFLPPVQPRAGPVRQLRHRGRHVRGQGGACVHRQARHRQDRGRLPRWLRRAVGLGQARCRRGRPRGCPGGPSCRSRSRPASSTWCPTTTSTGWSRSSPTTPTKSPPW